jgi:MASE1
MLADKIYTNLRPADLRRQGVEYVVELTGIAIIYVALAKLSLALASIHPSATPIWPPTGYALGAVLLLGYRVSPAIFLGALVANVTTAGGNPELCYPFRRKHLRQGERLPEGWCRRALLLEINAIVEGRRPCSKESCSARL